MHQCMILSHSKLDESYFHIRVIQTGYIYPEPFLYMISEFASPLQILQTVCNLLSLTFGPAFQQMIQFDVWALLSIAIKNSSYNVYFKNHIIKTNPEEKL